MANIREIADMIKNLTVAERESLKAMLVTSNRITIQVLKSL